MIARVHRNRFTNEFQFARELIELLAHLGQTFIHTGAVVLIACYIKKTMERGADEPGLGGAALLSGCRQPRDEFFADINTDFSLHGALWPAAVCKSVSRIFLTFDADLRHSIHRDRKACRDIRARCGAQGSQFRRDQRMKTGASVDIGDRILFADSGFTLASVGNGNC